MEVFPNVPYDGKFAFVRLRYSAPVSDFGSFGGRDLPWSHDYPRAERNFTKILQELSSVRVRTDGSVVVALDDPTLFRFPVAYMAEPGFWQPSETETLALRKYVRQGGFLIFDDFAGNHWMNFERQIQRVLPDAQLVRLAAAHPIFDAFYRIPSLDFTHPYYGRPSEFWGVFENNDPTQRLLLIANYNNDIAEYWEYSDTGFFALDASNDAFKLGINYIVYALSR